jgi:predicted peptidase
LPIIKQSKIISAQLQKYLKMKRSLLIIAGLLFCSHPQMFSQTLCRNAAANSTPGATEKYVYKTYLDKKGNKKDLHIGLTRPVDKLPEKKRPLVIGLQGSAFVNTCFFEPCYIKYSKNVLKPYFVPEGYATASIQYRLNSPFEWLKIDDDKLKETHYKAVQDARAAIKYIFENAEKLGVDTNNIFLIGTSAGAITALHSVYLGDDEVPEKLSEEHGKLEKRENIKAVISLSGAIYDLSYLKGGEKIPLMIVHGKDDQIVPFDKGFYLGLKKLTPVFGGKAIYDEAVKQTIPAKGYFYEFGHEYPSKVQTEIYKNANDFIRSYLNCAGEKLQTGNTKQ